MAAALGRQRSRGKANNPQPSLNTTLKKGEFRRRTLGGLSIDQESSELSELAGEGQMAEAKESDNAYEDDFEDDYGDDFEEDAGESGDYADGAGDSEYDSGDGDGHGDSHGEYADDFEDDDGEMSAVLEALRAENIQAGQAVETNDVTENAIPVSVSPVGAVPPSSSQGLNFKRAQEAVRDRAAERSRQRAKDLAKMVQLHPASFTLFEQAPMSEYELYIRNFGESGSVQTGVQCSVETAENDAQTVRVRSRSKWTQQPPTELRAVGGDRACDSDDDLPDGDRQSRNDTQRLGRFVTQAGAVVCALLEESLVLEHRMGSAVNPGPLNALSLSMVRLASTVPLLAGRQVVTASFSMAKPHVLLVGYGASSARASTGDALRARGLLCIWNTREPSAPLQVLMSESSPVCACFDPAKGSIVFAATEDGIINIWDLQEASSLHKEYSVGGTTHCVRSPTYSTQGIPDAHNHTSSVVAMSTITIGASVSTGTDSLQLATLDSDGVLKTWTLQSVPADSAGSLHELGLLPGGRLKLSASSSIKVELSGSSRMGIETQCTSLQLFPERPNQFVAGTDHGVAVHGVRFGKRCSPRQYRFPAQKVAGIRAVAFHPTETNFFLAGASNGDVALFNTNFELPLEVWTTGFTSSAVEWIEWSTSRPAVFFSRTAGGVIAAWDLLESTSGPVEVTDIAAADAGSENGRGAPTATALSGSPDEPELVLGYRDGSLECYQLLERFTVPDKEERDQVRSFLASSY